MPHNPNPHLLLYIMIHVVHVVHTSLTSQTPIVEKEGPASDNT